MYGCGKMPPTVAAYPGFLDCFEASIMASSTRSARLERWTASLSKSSRFAGSVARSQQPAFGCVSPKLFQMSLIVLHRRVPPP